MMKPLRPGVPIASLLAISCFHAEASQLEISPNSTVRAASAVEADYSTTHLYLNEVAGDSIPITVFFDPQTLGVETAEILTNLNRRDRATLDANEDGIEDGIIPPNANNIPAGNDEHYFKAYTMALVSGGYQVTLPASRTGAYRLTARYRLNGDTPGTYRYYNSEEASPGIFKRDHAIVVSPSKARDIQLFEVNPLTIIAEGTLPSQRGTFSDLADGLGAGKAPRFSMQYVKDLGCNTLWFQPIHPNGISGRQIDPDTSQPFEVGSPYAVKNFFEVMPLMAKSFTPGGTPATNDTAAGRMQAMAEFQSFAEKADTAGVDIMLDAPFNHTSYDCELAPLGQTLFGNAGSNPLTEFRNTEARFYARSGAYDMRASSAGNIAIAPDRIAEFAFNDTFEVYFGRYAALVSGSTPGHQNEADWFDYSIGGENSSGTGNGHFDSITRNVWRYFGAYIDHWLTQTGYPANPSGASLDSEVGVDSLRADFAQGLPPQCWEYLINRARTRKWNFVFMAESLDGGPVTYRSGRHFDILNENIVFPLRSAQNTSDYRAIYENRRNAYGQALVLLNSSSHDEDHYQDPFDALIRYAANSTIDGVPLIFPGQELGLSGAVAPPGNTQNGITPFGYDRYEVNFGKPIPHFKKYNSLMPLWLKTQVGDPSFDFGLAQLSEVYSGIGQARKFSSALRSSNRYFLNLADNTTHDQIFSVAKYETLNASPAFSDTMLCFVNLDRDSSPETPADNYFNVNIDTDGSGTNDFGINPSRTYNVKNIAAYLGADPTRRDTYLISGGTLGSDLIDDGLYVKLNKVPTSDDEWANAPYEAQYLKLYDVTPPPSPAPLAPKHYVIGTSGAFTWTNPGGPDDNITNYIVDIGTTPGGNDLLDNAEVTDGSNTINFTGIFGTTYYATITSVSAAGISATTPGSSDAGDPNPGSATTPLIVLDPNGDQDQDGRSNANEAAAMTDPLDGSSFFAITSIETVETTVTVSWDGKIGVTYVLQFLDDLSTGDWTDVPDSQTAGTGGQVSATHTVLSTDARMFYRVRTDP